MDDRGRKRSLEPTEADWLGRHDRVVNGTNEFLDRVFLVAAGPWFDGWDDLDKIPNRRKVEPKANKSSLSDLRNADETREDEAGTSLRARSRDADSGGSGMCVSVLCPSPHNEQGIFFCCCKFPYYRNHTTTQQGVEVAVLVNIDAIEDEKATVEIPLIDLVAYGTQLSNR